MGQKTIANLGKWGFNLILIFGLLHYDPISNVLEIDLKFVGGMQLITLMKVVIVCMFFGCVMFAGDEVISNAEKNSGRLVRIFVWVSDIMTSVKNSLKKKDDG